MATKRLPQTKEALTTPRGRLSWPNLFKPRESDTPGGKPKYTATLIFDEDEQKTPQFLALKKAANEIALEAFGIEQKQPNGTAKRVVPQGIRNPFRDGAEKVQQDGQPMSGYGPGKVFISASGVRPPLVVGPDAKPVDEATCYAGCWARARVTVYAYENKGNKGVTFGLRGVQKVADGEPFGGGAGGSFEPVEGYEAGATGGADDPLPF